MVPSHTNDYSSLSVLHPIWYHGSLLRHHRHRPPHQQQQRHVTTMIMSLIVCLLIMMVALPTSDALADCAAQGGNQPIAVDCPSNCGSCVQGPVPCYCGVCCACTIQYFYNFGSAVSSIPGPNCAFQCPYYTCVKTCTGPTTTCATCAAGYYGATCTPCLSGNDGRICSGATAGTCNDGITGDGKCTCQTGYNGTQCEYSRANTCNGKGNPTMTGGCVCDLPWGGNTCSTCATNYFGSTCSTYCFAATTCQGYGTCPPGSDGKCSCNSQYSSTSSVTPTCDKCAANYYNWPQCRYCIAANACNGRGQCADSGAALCTCNGGNANYIDGTCSQCIAGRYGTSCQGQCVSCGVGTCRDGVNGDGGCNCPTGYNGAQCQYSDTGTCASHGIADASNGCTCQNGYNATTNCGTCVDSYYGFPSCKYCTTSMCGNVGSCDYQGNCTCPIGTAPPTCQTCLVDRYNWPTCKLCRPSIECNNQGTCDNAYGTCSCVGAYTGDDCLSCKSGYYGALCSSCPGGASSPCGGDTVGTCNDGRSGDGKCVCKTPFRGAICTDPYMSEINTFASLIVQRSTEGGLAVQIRGGFFGAAPIVLIGSNPATNCTSISLSTDGNAIQCTTRAAMPQPGGIASIIVIRTPDRVTSNIGNFTFKPPAITQVSPSLGPAVGGITVSIIGTDFSTNPIVTWNGQLMSYISADHRLIVLITPAGIGKPVITVSVAGQNVSTIYTYTPATISSTSGNGAATIGGSALTINGLNFGPSSASISVTIGGSACGVTSHTDILLYCTLPSGVGQQAGILTVATSNVPFIYTYGSMTIETVRGCSGPSLGSATTQCPPTGGIEITVTGTNFGSAITVGSDTLSITVVSAICTSPRIVTAHTSIACTLPFAVGRPATLTLTRASQSLSGAYLYFLGPSITNGTLTLSGQAVTRVGPYITTVVPSSVNGGQRVTFGGQSFGTNTSQVTVAYGAIDRPSLYDCINIGQLSDTSLSCDLSPGVGTNLMFRVIVAGIPTPIAVLAAADYIRYPVPIIRNGTLRTFTSEGALSAASSIVASAVQTGEPIAFDVDYIGTVINDVHVTYGPIGQPSAFICSVTKITPLTNTTSRLYCTTSPGDGQHNYFTVTAGLLTASQQSLGPDQYNYPVTPQIFSISGCSGGSTSDNGTLGCPTPGGVILTITGLFFSASSLVTIGGVECAQTLPSPLTSTTTLTTRLPAGAGLAQTVYVRSGKYNSRPANLVNYAVPSITSITGCTSVTGSVTSVVNCARVGNQNITLIGTNFGASLATVVVGGRLCTHVVHTVPHTRVTCTLPSSTSLERPVTLIQDRGELSTELIYVSSTQCQPGTAAPPEQIACIQCWNGTFTKVEASATCSICPLGQSASMNGATTCSSCTAGRFSNGTGSSICTSCAVGRVGGFDGLTTCADCSTGTYTQGTGASICTSCAQGYRNPSSGQSVCQQCNAGTIAATVGSSECIQCELGTIQAYSGRSSCDVCIPGQYMPTRGNTTCLSCPIGSYSDAQRATQCTTCDTGRWAATIGLALCTACPIGYYANGAACQACDLGKVAANEGSSACTDCEAGSYANATGLGVCSACPPGYYSPPLAGNVGSSSCSICSAGYITPATGQSICQQCVNGKYANSTGMSTCSSCTSGRYTNYVDGIPDRCIICSPGKFSLGDDQTGCTLCAAGSATATNGSISCTTCTAGYIAASAGATTCTACTPGSASSSPGAVACGQCARGKYASTYANSSCIDCPIGSIAADLGASICTQCAAGSYVGAGGLFQCTDCDYGYYQSFPGQDGCIACPKGSERGRDSVDATQCTNCTLGRYAPSDGSSVCSQCGYGTISSISGATICQSCSPGEYQSTQGQSVCQTCTAGSYIDFPGQAACLGCDAGTYAASNAASICIECGPGKYSIPGSTICSLCSEGTYNAGYHQPECVACPKGSVAPLKGAQNCTDCIKGYYQDSTGQTQCDPCPLGTRGVTTRAEVCTKCEAGSYGNVTGLESCYQCNEGYEAIAPGQASCTACQSGAYSSNIGAAACTACPLGRAANTTGLTECNQCDIGTSQPLVQQSTCVQCQPGRAVASLGNSDCLPCAAGRYSGVNGSIDCVDCAIGRFAANGAQSQCDACVPGRYNIAQSQQVCLLCESGKHSTFGGSDHCDPCPAGTQQYAIGKSYCDACDLGKSSSANAIQCLSCDRGTHASTTNSSTCLPCSSGKAQPNTGQAECIECAPGRAVSADQQLSCIDCARGEYANGTGLATCLQCPAGFYTDSTGQPTCISCAPGTASLSPGQSTCVTCTAGTYSGTSSPLCRACPAGRASSSDGAETCIDCDPGRYAASPNSQTCIVCGARTAAPSAGEITCFECDSNSESNTERTQCLCNVGYYAGEADVLTGKIICHPCPRGGECDEVGISYLTLEAKAGYWRDSNTSLSFYKCLLPIHCLGGFNSECGGHRTGPICAICAAGYRSNSGISTCSACPTKSTATALVVILSLVIVIVILFIYWLVLRADRDLYGKVLADDNKSLDWEADGPNTSTKFDDTPTAGGHTRLPSASPTSDTAKARRVAREEARRGAATEATKAAMINQFVAARQAKEHAFEDARMRRGESKSDRGDAVDEVQAAVVTNVSGPKPPPPNFTYKLKIIVSFLQVTTNFAFILDVPWPTYYRTFMDAFSLVNLDFVPWQSVGCVTLLDFYGKLLAVAITPVCVLTLLVALYLLPQYYLASRLPRDSARDMMVYKAARKRARRKFWKLLLFTMFLMYPFVSSTVLRFFVCKDVYGTEYLLADFTLQCGDSRWDSYLAFAIAMTIIYPIGVPLFFFWMIWRYRNRLHEAGVQLQLGFLYAAYHPTMWWFEMFDMANKLVLTSFVAFLPTEGQMPAALAYTALYVVTILLMRPYLRKGDDRLALLVEAEIFLVILAAYILVDGGADELSSSVNIALSVLFIALTIGLILVFIAMAAINLRKIVISLQRRRKYAKQIAEQNDSHSSLLSPTMTTSLISPDTRRISNATSPVSPSPLVNGNHDAPVVDAVLARHSTASDSTPPSDKSSNGSSGIEMTTSPSYDDQFVAHHQEAT